MRLTITSNVSGINDSHASSGLQGSDSGRGTGRRQETTMNGRIDKAVYGQSRSSICSTEPSLSNCVSPAMKTSSWDKLVEGDDGEDPGEAYHTRRRCKAWSTAQSSNFSQS